MKSFESDIKAYAEKTRLKMNERAQLRERILSYMEYHPLKKQEEDMAHLRERVTYITWKTEWVRLLAGGFALFLFVGVPFLAERAVPGDVLYLVKTEVNESIRTQLATSPYEKVTLETRLIERRIAEARVLREEGKLTPEVEAQIAETVKDHASAVQTGINQMKEESADEAALAKIVFSSALEVQSAVLGEGSSQGATTTSSLLDVVNAVREEVRANEDTATPSYASITARIETETTRAYELFATIKGSATEEETSDIERRLADIDRSIVAAKEAAVTDETEATTLMVDTLGLIQKLITFMTDIDIRETVALETLVPITLTPSEEQSQLGAELKELTIAENRFTTSIDAVTDGALREKIVAALYTLGTSTQQAGDMLAKNDFDGARSVIKEAKIIAADLGSLMAPFLTETDGMETSTSTESLPSIGVASSTPTSTESGTRESTGASSTQTTSN